MIVKRQNFSFLIVLQTSVENSFKLVHTNQTKKTFSVENPSKSVLGNAQNMTDKQICLDQHYFASVA